MLFCFSHFNPREIKHLHNASFEKILGEGTFGKVKIYRCKERNCNGIYCEQCFVIKTIKVCSFKKKMKYIFLKNKREKIKEIENESIKMLLNEWEIGKNLDNKYIIKTLDIDIQKRSLIFEYYESIDLYNYITEILFESNPPYSLKKQNQYAIDIFKQIINGLKYLHENKIAHLDLKLENIIINFYTREIKIIDFGQAMKFSEDSEKSIKKLEWGTINYLPPEYFEVYNSGKESKVDLIKTDIWAAGMIFYNFIYNSTPWNVACYIKDSRFKMFLQYAKYNMLTKHLFPDLYHKEWSINNVKIINCLLLNFFRQDYKARISVDQTIEKLNELMF